MNLQVELGIRAGVTSVIGSGGKTTLLAALADELSANGATVALTTTTRILPFEGVATWPGTDCSGAGCGGEDRLAGLLSRERVVCAASPAEAGKLGAPGIPMERLAELADYVLVEADGSKRLPLKAHAAWEPVVPACSGQVICVVGASGFGRPVREAVHRPEAFCRLAGCAGTDPATPELVAAAIRAEGLCDRVVVNQCEDEAAMACAARLAAGLDVPVSAGSIRDRALLRV